MIATRGIRRRLGSVAAATLVLSAVLGGSASASTPGWGTSFVTPTPAAVTAGADAGYKVTIVNNGTSNISQVYLTEAATGAIPSTPPPTTYVHATQGTCDPVGVRLHCALGAVRAGRSATVTVAYSTAGLEGTTFQRIFEVNTTGVAGDSNGNSHGDVIQLVGTTTTGSGPDFAGRFIVDGTLSVSDSTVLGSANLQSTTVTAPHGTIGVSVGDGPSTFTCPTVTPCWSQTSELHVDNGAAFAAGFRADIGIYRDLATTVHGFYHAFDAPHADGSVGEYVTAKCSSATPPASQMPCFRVTKLSGGSLSIAVWLKENGTIRFN